MKKFIKQVEQYKKRGFIMKQVEDYKSIRQMTQHYSSSLMPHFIVFTLLSGIIPLAQILLSQLSTFSMNKSLIVWSS